MRTENENKNQSKISEEGVSLCCFGKRHDSTRKSQVFSLAPTGSRCVFVNVLLKALGRLAHDMVFASSHTWNRKEAFARLRVDGEDHTDCDR
jgi:hypothetical protein